MRHRLPRRQGVVYGPLARQERPDNGGVLGRILGAVVVVAAVGVLGVGAMGFLGDGGTAVVPGSPTPTPTAQPSPTLTPGPTTTAPPSPTAIPTPTPEPTPSPTPFAIEIREGAGNIWFGSDYRTNPGRIVGASTTFSPGDPIAWIADLGSRANTNAVRIEVHRYDPADDSEVLTWDEDFTFSNSTARRFLRRFNNVNALTDGPGIYVVRYSIGGNVRAEGYFRLIEA
jgi:hypothetical protein